MNNSRVNDYTQEALLQLVHVADLEVTVGPAIEIGPTPAGLRRVIPITGGKAKGPRITGEVLPVGADFQIIRNDGVVELYARYVIRTDDGALIYVENNGLRHGSPAAMEKIRRGEPVDSSELYFRAAPRFETAAGSYLWLTKALFVCEGARRPDRVELGFYEI